MSLNAGNTGKRNAPERKNTASTCGNTEAKPMKHAPEPTNRVPYYKRPDRKRTPHATAVACMEKGWTCGNVKHANREAWEAEVLKYGTIQMRL